MYRAAWSLSEGDPDATVHASMAKALASEAAVLAARTALQVHGAIGYTWEHDLHLWMKRAWSLAAAWGDAAWHRARILDTVSARGEPHAPGPCARRRGGDHRHRCGPRIVRLPRQERHRADRVHHSRGVGRDAEHGARRHQHRPGAVDHRRFGGGAPPRDGVPVDLRCAPDLHLRDPAGLPAGPGARPPGRSLAVYAGTEGIIEVVGPRGWSCSALFAADGSSALAVYPPAQPLPASWSAQWHLAGGSADEAVVADETSACAGCTVGQACPLFTGARSAFASEFGRPCPTRPAQERVGQEGAGIVSFEDPAGVTGDGSPSGGVDPADGVMTYYPDSTEGSWLETCTMPSSPDAGLCATVLGDFLSR